MAATALLKFEIDAVDGPDGHAAELIFSALPKNVVVKNSDNTGVGSWQLDLVYSPPGATTPATIELAFSDGVSALNFTLPINLPGSWRLVFKVWTGANRTGAPTDIDIRNVMAKTASGLHIPPPQIFPLPLPSLSSGLPGAKPNEANLGGREDLGWAGNDSDGLLNDFLRHHVPGGGGVSGPGGSVVGHIATWSNTSGTAIDDSGVDVSAIATAQSTANSAGTAAVAAQTTANSASTAAAAAQTTANSASTAAAAAQTSADHNPFMESDLAKSSNFTLALTDLYQKIRLTAALTITVPLHATVALPVGIRIPLLADVAGFAQVTVAPFSGAVTVKKATSLSLTLREQGSPAELWQQATDVWWLLGDLTIA